MIHLSLRVGEITTESYIEIPRVSHLCFIAKSLYEFLSINAMSVYNKYIDIYIYFLTLLNPLMKLYLLQVKLLMHKIN